MSTAAQASTPYAALPRSSTAVNPARAEKAGPILIVASEVLVTAMRVFAQCNTGLPVANEDVPVLIQASLPWENHLALADLAWNIIRREFDDAEFDCNS